MASMARGRTRDGFGILLVLVLATVAMLAVVGMGHACFTSSVSSQTRMDSFGTAADELAGNALTEAHFVMSRMVNGDVDADAFDAFRTEGSSSTVVVPLASLPCLQRELDEAGGFELVGESVTVERTSDERTSETAPSAAYRHGTFAMTATVGHSCSGAGRRLTWHVDYKVSLLGPPRPMDVHTVVVLDGSALVDGATPANAQMDRTAERLDELQGLVERVEASCRTMYDEFADQSDDARAMLQEALDLLAFVRADWPDVDVTHFPTASYAVVCDDQNVSVADLALPVTVRRRLDAIDERQSTQETAYLDFSRTFASLAKQQSRELVTRLATWCTAVSALADELEALLVDDYGAFQRRFRTVDGDEYDALQRAGGTVTAGEYGRCATAVVTTADELRALLDRGPACHAVVRVADGSSSLVVDHTFSGRTVLVVEGDATVRQAAVADGTNDLLTIVCLGRCRIEGTVHGSVIVAGQVELTAEAAVVGTLATLRGDVRAFDDESAAPATVTRDERVAAGPSTWDGTAATVTAGRLHVSLGPAPMYAELERF